MASLTSKKVSELVVALSRAGEEEESSSSSSSSSSSVKTGAAWKSFGDRDSAAEALADVGTLVVQNLNKGVDLLVASSEEDDSALVQKAKRQKIYVVKPSFIAAAQKAGEDGRIDLKPHLLFAGDEGLPDSSGANNMDVDDGEEDVNWDEDELPLGKHLSAFPTPFYVGEYEDGDAPLLLAELRLLALNRSIRMKPQWDTKLNDASIVKKWKKEASEQGVSEKGFKFVLAELKWLLTQRDGPIEPSTVDGTWQADGLVDSKLRTALLKAVEKLEDVPEEEKDWHPGSNNQVLDLVHPSLFPLVFGVTRALDKEATKDPVKQLKAVGNTSVVRAEKPDSAEDYTWSMKYQWLPSEFRVHKTGKVRIESYINNLHPEWYKEMYPLLGKIFEKFVPMFEKVLTRLQHPLEPRLPEYEWYQGEEDDEDIDYDADDYEEQERARKEARFVEPEIPYFEPPPPPPEVVNLKGRRLQVIVKLANIVLTPENPSYPGGTWHVEGMENEHIVASGIYYYVSKNITESRLEFRAAVKEPNYEQGDDYGVERAYGLLNEEPLNQPRGYVLTKEDRCICFPNTLQHKVAPFKLADETKNGVRKILVFFLVDPTVRIRSTATVPPQQQHWMLSSVRGVSASTSTHFSKLPDELLEKIVSNLPLMSMKEAKQHREELMKERKYFVEENNKSAFEREFSLCEH